MMPTIGVSEIMILLVLCLVPIAVAGFLLWFTARRRSRLIPPVAEARPLKICPFCAEPILAEARICRYCGRELNK